MAFMAVSSFPMFQRVPRTGSDGSEKPYRVRVRPPSFHNLSCLPHICEGGMVADVVAAIGSLDIVLGEIDR